MDAPLMLEQCSQMAFEFPFRWAVLLPEELDPGDWHLLDPRRWSWIEF
jgi:hypothetical protein